MRHLSSYHKLLIVAVLAVTMVATFSDNNSASASHGGSVVCDPGTGHCYELVETAMDWYAAKAHAETLSHDGVSGHLATITSAAETSFITSSFPSLFALADTPDEKFAWFGGFRPGNSTSGWGSWEWVTGEPWSYDNWAPGEPSSGLYDSDGVQGVTEFFHDGPPSYTYTGAWNDQNPTGATRYFIVEFDAPPASGAIVIDDFVSGDATVGPAYHCVGYASHSDASIHGGKRQIVVIEGHSGTTGNHPKASYFSTGTAEWWGRSVGNSAVGQWLSYGTAIGLVTKPWCPNPETPFDPLNQMNLTLTTADSILLDMAQVDPDTPNIHVRLIAGTGQQFYGWFPVTAGVNSIPLSAFPGLTDTIAADIDGIEFHGQAGGSGITLGNGHIFNKISVSAAADAPVCVTHDLAGLADFQLNGSAATHNPNGAGVLRLTSSGGGQAGSAFSTSTIDLANAASFSTAFSFRIHGSGNGGADGLAFVIQPNSNTAGSSGGGLGYMGIGNSLAVEFDTWNNWDWGDPDANHVGISLNGNINSVVTANLNSLGQLDAGGVWYGWIDYDGNVGTLEVRVATSNSRPAAPTVSLFNLDLESVLGQTDAYVGFSGATGWAYSAHDILSFEFCSDVQNEVEEPNAAPEIAADASSIVINEGALADNTGTFSDADGDTVSLSVSSGPGSVSDAGSNTWSWTNGVEADDASYSVTVEADDGNGGSADVSFGVTVNNVAPEVTASGGTVVIGTPAGVSANFTDAGVLDTHSAVINWGDTSSSTGNVTETVGTGEGTVAGLHFYAATGVYTVTVTVTDDDGGVGTATTTITVINNPPVADAGGPYTVYSGEVAELDASDSYDRDGHSINFEWDLDNDGYSDWVGATANYPTAGLTPGVSYTVGLTVCDAYVLCTSTTTTITVERLPVDIDVKPGSDVNPLNLNGNGVVPIAVLTTDDFDATTIDPSTVLAGVNGDNAAPHHNGHVEDVDGDGDLDMVFHFREWELGIDSSTAEALDIVPLLLTGVTTSGVFFEGTDTVRINPNNGNSKDKNEVADGGKGGPKGKKK